MLKFTKIRSHGEIMKTTLTQEIEKALYYYCLELGGIVVEEVTMPDEQGIVDTLACFFKPNATEWRCYELKVKAFFYRSLQLFRINGGAL